MKSRVTVLCVAIVGAMAVASWLRLAADGQQFPAPQPIEPAQGVSRPQVPRAVPATHAGEAILPQAAQARRPPLPPTGNPAETADQETGLLLDASGRLVKNAQVRDEIERLLSSNPSELAQAKQDLVATLPPAAAQEALDLVDRFVNYRAAMRQALPESPQAMTDQDALVMLDTMHALRVTYFGPELTEVFFGAEEAIGRGTAEGMRDASGE